MSELRVMLLGTPRLELDRTPIKIRRRKVLALLAYLAVTGQPHIREALAALLWPDFDAPDAYAYLRNALWLVRQTPVGDWLDAERDELALRRDDSLWVDIAHFEAYAAACGAHGHPDGQSCMGCIALLEQAAELYRGDFMAGFSLEDSAAFDEWQFFQAETARQTMGRILRRLVFWHSQHAALETALDYARRWQSLDPLHEVVPRYLMRLYAQMDRRPAALHVYDALISDLRTQGLAPPEETVSLYRRIRAGTFPDASERPTVTAELSTPSPQVRKAGALPRGTVTFLFTDIQGSVELWDQKPAAMERALTRHNTIAKDEVTSHGGVIYKVIGDGFQAAFALAPQALLAAIAIQRAVSSADWGEIGSLSVRIGLHTGSAEPLQGEGQSDYTVGHTLNRTARIMSAGHGGQILISQEAATLALRELPLDITLRDLGPHRLKGLARAEYLFQVVGPGLPSAFPRMTTAVSPSHNLPVQAASFVGRRSELHELQSLLRAPEARLITLTGPGGIGKTRLAVRAAEESLDTFADGVHFVPLAEVETPALVVSSVADVLGLVHYQQEMTAPLAQLVSFLRDKQLLLVLDNLEQINGAGVLIAEIVRLTQQPKFLITSRQRLNLRDEWVLELNGLAYPDARHATYDGAQFGAIQLFLDRAQQVSRSLSPNAEDLTAIARICHLVGGMPLALELAASWLKILSPREIADEITANLDFLSLALRDLPERHQSLRAVFSHSWRLLSDDERACYRALSVFRGGFTRIAALDVAGASLPMLASLIDRSMLRRTPSGRVEILEVLRQYAEEQLRAEPVLQAAIGARHSAYYLGLLERAEPALKGPGADEAFGQIAALNTIHQDFANVRAAWSWAGAHGKAAEIRAAAVSLALFSDIHSRFRDGLELVSQALSAFETPIAGSPPPQQDTQVPPETVGLLWAIRGHLTSRLSMPGAIDALQRSIGILDTCGPVPELALANVLSSYAETWFSPEEMARRLNKSMAIFQMHDDRWGMALTLSVIGEGLDLGVLSDREAAKMHTHQSLELRQQIGDHWGTAMSFYTLGIISELEGHFQEAREYYQQSLDVRQKLQNAHGSALCMQCLGRIAYRLGDLDEAHQLHSHSLEIWREIGALMGIPDSLEALASIAQSRNDPVAAKSYLLEACALRREVWKASVPLASALLKLGDTLLTLGDREAADGCFEESLALARALGYAQGCVEAAERLQHGRADL